MAALFDKDSDKIGLHLKNIYKDGELDEMSTTEESSVVRQEGRRTLHQGLDGNVSLHSGLTLNQRKFAVCGNCSSDSAMALDTVIIVYPAPFAIM